MLERKWECHAVYGQDFTIEVLGDGCLLWTSMLGSKECALSIVHCSTYIDWRGLLNFCGFYWERFPADSSEQGMYYYLVSQKGKRKLLKSIEKLFDRNVLLPLQSGPAVLDFPIIPAVAMEDTVGLEYYMDNLRYNHFEDIDNYDMLRMYEFGCKQFELLPGELTALIPWYEFQIFDEYLTHKRLVEQSTRE